MYQPPPFESSFSEHDLGRTIYELVCSFSPSKIVEFGALNGYSSAVFIQSLLVLGSEGSKLVTVDLFEEYNYKNCSLATYKQNLESLSYYPSRITHEIIKMDVLSDDIFLANLTSTADLVFIDISNDGDKLSSILPFCKCPVVFEGGSQERDQIWWMVNYGKSPIRSIWSKGYSYGVIDARFPSLSLYVPTN